MRRKASNTLLAASAAMLMAVMILPAHAQDTSSASPSSSQKPESSDNPLSPIPTMPADMPVIPEGSTANLTLRYFDDEDETIPAKGTEFTIYQVASIGTDVDNNGMYVPLDKDLSFHDAPEVTEYQKKVISRYTENPEIGVTRTEAIQDNGEAVFEDLKPGAYFVTESKTIRFHIASQSFLVSVPETEKSGGKHMSTAAKVTAKSTSPQTGVNTDIMGYVLACGIASFSVMYLIDKRRKAGSR